MLFYVFLVVDVELVVIGDFDKYGIVLCEFLLGGCKFFYGVSVYWCEWIG